MLIDSSAEILSPRFFDVLPTSNQAVKDSVAGSREVTAKLFTGVIPLYERNVAVSGIAVENGWAQISVGLPRQIETWEFFFYGKHKMVSLHLHTGSQNELAESILVPGTTFDYTQYKFSPTFKRAAEPPHAIFALKEGVKADQKILQAGDFDLNESRVEGDVPIAMNSPEKALALVGNLTQALRKMGPLRTARMRELDSHRIEPLPKHSSYTQAWF